MPPTPANRRGPSDRRTPADRRSPAAARKGGPPGRNEAPPAPKRPGVLSLVVGAAAVLVAVNFGLSVLSSAPPPPAPQVAVALVEPAPPASETEVPPEATGPAAEQRDFLGGRGIDTFKD